MRLIPLLLDPEPPLSTAGAPSGDITGTAGFVLQSWTAASLHTPIKVHSMPGRRPQALLAAMRSAVALQASFASGHCWLQATSHCKEATLPSLDALAAKPVLNCKQAWQARQGDSRQVPDMLQVRSPPTQLQRWVGLEVSHTRLPPQSASMVQSPCSTSVRW
jgi:hypothetical protein